ncbi:MAG: bifunctional 3-deoxy-7-phosphoheptulonate synthase/chorismate mutase [Bacteroidia bacterium]
MIVHISKNLSESEVHSLAADNKAAWYESSEHYIFILPSAIKVLPQSLEKCAIDSWALADDIQLASKTYRSEIREVSWAQTVTGGNTNNTVMIAGPCSVESEEQLELTAQLLIEQGIKNLRAGAFKPRTSPYTFQGLGLEGLKMLDKIRSKYGFGIITEVRDATNVEAIIEYADVIQIGAKSMYDHGILKRCGQARKPVLLKRGFGSTLQELVQCAEFILSAGNEQVMLCERGIRTFETKTRFTLDLCGVAYLKEHTNLPVILDPSHAMGLAYGVPDLARACVAMGVDGLLVETHPNPSVAKSDAAQQLNYQVFRDMMKTLNPIATAVGRKMV